MHDHLVSALIGSDPITRRQALQRLGTLLGGALSASALGSLAAGCSPGRSDTTAAFTVDQRELLAVISEHIIPKTDTPGARAVGVPEFIEVIWREVFPAAEQDSFRAGLAEVDERAQQAHGRRFLDSTPEQQLAVLTALDTETFDAPPEPEPEPPEEVSWEPTEPSEGGTPLPTELDAVPIDWRWGERQQERTPQPFWRTMKRLTLVGYYTSEAGATQELRYEPIPGRYDGCVPFEQIGRTWAA